MKGKISYKDQNMFISPVNLGILTLESVGSDSLLEPASSGR